MKTSFRIARLLLGVAWFLLVLCVLEKCDNESETLGGHLSLDVFSTFLHIFSIFLSF